MTRWESNSEQVNDEHLSLYCPWARYVALNLATVAPSWCDCAQLCECEGRTAHVQSTLAR